MAYNGESLIATAIERLNENMLRMDERWNESMKEMRGDFKHYQQSTDMKIDKTNDLLGKLVHIDTEMKEGNKRVHHRIDEVEKKVQKIDDARQSGGCPTFRQYSAKMEGLNLEDRIIAIETKGTKRWEAVMIKLLEYGVLFVLASVALRFGVKL